MQAPALLQEFFEGFFVYNKTRTTGKFFFLFFEFFNFFGDKAGSKLFVLFFFFSPTPTPLYED